MNINDFENFQEKTIAEFKVAIYKAEELFLQKIKEKDIIGALEAKKTKLKLENLLNKKISRREKNEQSSHKRS